MILFKCVQITDSDNAGHAYTIQVNMIQSLGIEKERRENLQET